MALLPRNFQQLQSRQTLVYVSVEGEKREKLYFEAVSALVSVDTERSVRLEIDYPPTGESSPTAVLNRAKAFRRLHSYTDPYRAWLVMDMDRQHIPQIETLRSEIE